ncbi:MAG: methyltransferase domain-containing protein [Myxococcales bacterium]
MDQRISNPPRDPTRRGEPFPGVATAAGLPRNEVAPPAVPSETARRWESEARFFDELGARMEREVRPMSEALRARYLGRPRRIFDKEFRFRLVGDLRGQVALDLGCGEGSNAVLLAERGAHVEGVDISPGLVEIARRRARLDGVEQRVRLQCTPIEQVCFPPETFDLVWGDGILHHLVGVLEPTLERLARWAKKGALFVFSEPVSESRLLRALRGAIPLHAGATPDERPLGRPDLELLRRFLPGLRERRFTGLSRLTPLLAPGSTYDGASPLRRWTVDALHVLDYALLSVPALRPLGGMSVLWGRRQP